MNSRDTDNNNGWGGGWGEPTITIKSKQSHVAPSPLKWNGSSVSSEDVPSVFKTVPKWAKSSVSTEAFNGGMDTSQHGLWWPTSQGEPSDVSQQDIETSKGKGTETAEDKKVNKYKTMGESFMRKTQMGYVVSGDFQRLSGKYEEMASDFSEMTITYMAMVSDYEGLSNKHQDLLKQYEDLQNQHQGILERQRPSVYERWSRNARIMAILEEEDRVRPSDW